jgi:hypothetical protein
MMNYDKDVQFVLRGNLTRMWDQFCGEYDKEIGLSFPFPKQNLEKIQIYIVWSYSIRWCVDACKVRTFSSHVHLCFLYGISIGIWGCLCIVIFVSGFLSIFFSIEWWRTRPRNKRSNMEMTCDMHST